MDNEKMESVLNLAGSASKEIRERSEVLNTGYDGENDSWEVIVKYNGDLQAALPQGITLEPLIAGYGILTIPSPLMENVPPDPLIEYAELPKRLYFEQESKQTGAVLNGPAYFLRDDTIDGEADLTGKGVLAAVIDSGIDYTLPNFRNPDGSTRIAALWDQTLAYDPDNPPPDGFSQGRLYDPQKINSALVQAYPAQTVPSLDTSGHGTAVAGILASGRMNGGYVGVAPQADLLIVKLGNPGNRGFPRTTELMRALTFSARFALERNQPLAVNLSFGNSYGSHNGASLLERFLDNLAEIGRSVICVGTGNEGQAGGHYSGWLNEGQAADVEIQVASYEAGLNIQFWKNYVDEYNLRLIAPDGEEILISPRQDRRMERTLGQTRVLCFCGQPTPYSTNQEIYFELLPQMYYLDRGIWRIRLEPERIRNGFFYLYLPVASTRNLGTRFLNASPEMTLTIPSTSARTIAVSAYHPMTDTFADFSGRGASVQDYFQERSNIGAIRPTLAAPGVDIAAPEPGGGYSLFTGTSFAAPFVTGAAACMMEWGILLGHDYYLYGEKLKAKMMKAALPLSGIESYPSEKAGYGRLGPLSAALK